MEQEKKKKHKVLRGIIGIVVVLVVVGAIFGNKSQSNDSNSSDTSSNVAESTESNSKDSESKDSKKEQVITLGTEFTAGDWSVTVKSIDEPVTSVGKSQYIKGAEAQGQFIPVTLSIKNSGKKASYFFTDNVKLKDTNGNEYAYNSDATIWGAEHGALRISEQVNPGNTLEGKIWFDVPTDAKISELTFSGSFFSRPVSVKLGD